LIGLSLCFSVTIWSQVVAAVVSFCLAVSFKDLIVRTGSSRLLVVGFSLFPLFSDSREPPFDEGLSTPSFFLSLEMSVGFFFFESLSDFSPSTFPRWSLLLLSFFSDKTSLFFFLSRSLHKKRCNQASLT